MLKYDLSLDHNHVDTRFVRARLILEEATELIIGMQEHDREAVIDAVADLLYVCYGAACLYGFDADEAMDRVHTSNMTKGQDTGHGKLLKGPDWVPPDFTGL
jgi:predicted HAD superfamily Cof-like phosphohydrolase